MEKLIQIGLCIILIALGFFSACRAKWAYSVRKSWSESFSKEVKKWTAKKRIDLFQKYAFSDLDNAVASYEEIFWKFWIWNPEKFIKDWDTFQVIMGEGENRTIH